MNIAGLLPDKLRGKVKLLEEMVQIENTLLLSLTESHLTQNVKGAEVYIENYAIFRTDRSDNIMRKKGGIITYVKYPHATRTKVLLSESNSYTEAQVLSIVPINMIFITIYRPPACPSDRFMGSLTKIINILDSLSPPMPTIVVTGDLNFPLIDWELESVYGGAENMRTQAEAFLNLASEFCLTQFVHAPTRGDNILDIVMSNNDDLIHNITIYKTNMSDHNIITLTTKLTTDVVRTMNSMNTEHLNVNFNQLNFFSDAICWDELKGELGEVDSQLGDSDPEAQYNLFLKLCLHISIKHVPLRKSSPKKKLPHDRKILMRKGTNLRKNMKNRSINCKRFEAKIKDIDDKLKASVEKEYSRKESRAVSCIKCNPKYFYNYAASKSEVRIDVGPLMDANGKTIYEPEAITDILRLQFERVFCHPYNEKIIVSPIEFFTGVSEPSLTHIEFTKN